MKKTMHKQTLLITTLLATFTLASCDKVKEQATEKAKEVAMEKANEAINKTKDKVTDEIQKQVDTTVEAESSTDTAEDTDTPTINFNGEFDWSKIPVSTANIGSFPYISVPDGMYHWKSDTNSDPAPANQSYTKMWDFDKLIMFDGTNVFDAEGKRAFLYVEMKDDNQDFAQLKFDKSVERYLNSIGAVEIFNDHLSKEILDKLDEKDDMTVFRHITGDVWGEPIRQYALNHTNGKIFFQVLRDLVHGEIGVVELEAFEQSIKAPTASEIKQQLDANGKAVLHINFDTGKASMKPDGQAVVEQINLLLTQNPDIKLSIEGHTDNVGDSASNQKLSENRANTVMYALAGKGIDVTRLSAKGFGDTKPIVANDSDENKAKNRRVELVKQ